jgi:predicted RNA-binding protein with TRAM domain
LEPRYSIGDLLEVRIEKIVPRGFGLAFAEGLTLFVSLKLPGDVLSVRIREPGRTAFARSTREPAALHKPPCEYSARAAGAISNR